MPDDAYQDMGPIDEREEQELQAIASEVLAAFVAPIDEEVARAHMLAIMREVSDPSRMSLEPAPKSRVRRRAFRLVAATGLGLGMLTGLAFAGALPDAMQDALSEAADRAGFSLPASEAHRQDAEHRKDDSQSGDKGKSRSADVKEVLNDDSLEGKDKGDAVSDTASQNRQNDEHANPQGVTDTATTPPDGQGNGNGNGNKPDKP